MIETTCCGGTVKLVASCSGRSNVGQIANRLMVDMERMGVLKGFCITGVGAGLSGFVESAKAAELIMIDGCPTGCGKKVLANNGVEPKRYFVITELLGIKKGDLDDSFEADAKQALGQVMANI
jgi:uncharacterized metal-binding protein